jgi:hypothetical protein
MQQGVILLGPDNSFLFMNTKIKSMIKLAMDQNPQVYRLIEEYMVEQGLETLNEEDLKEGGFLDLKIFDKKINDEEMIFGARRNSSVHFAKMSFRDLVLHKKESSSIYMIQNSDPEKHFYFCLQTSSVFQDN